MTRITCPHDRVFKAAMADIRVAREFFAHYSPAYIRDKIDLDSLEFYPTSYVDKKLKLSQADIVYKVQIAGEADYLLILAAEHQSNQDKLMPYRLVRYTVDIWTNHLKQTTSKRLPLVVSIVFYHGRKPYSCTRDIRDLIAAPRDLIEQALWPPFQLFHLIDTHDLSNEILCEQQWAGIMIFFMKHIFKQDFLPYLQTIMPQLRILEQIPEATEYVVSLLQYVLSAAAMTNIEKFIEMVKTELSAPIGVRMMTIAEQLIEQGKQSGIQQGILQGIEQGMQKGLQKGIQKGIQKGERVLFLRQLKLKFILIPKKYLAKIDAAEEKLLLTWGERLIKAKNLQEIFGD